MTDTTSELEQQIMDIIHKTYKHSETTYLLETIATEEILALLAVQRQRWEVAARKDELKNLLNSAGTLHGFGVVYGDYTEFVEKSSIDERIAALDDEPGKEQ